ncbi:diacylglycerol kinase family protein [Candidatus Dojkabacteria bacterium]|nr:diacylglycerol kinase family protein [Candidatus Dojkabacteria bacterium]
MSMGFTKIISSKTKKHLRSYRAAFSGLSIAFNHELNFQIELIAMAGVIIAGIIFPITKLEWIIIIFCIGITLSAELMNTSIEVLGELKRFHSVIKKIKDLAAAAVLAVAIMDVILAVMIFWPYIRDKF